MVPDRPGPWHKGAMHDAFTFAWLCFVLAIIGHVAQLLGARLWAALAIGAALSVSLVLEGATIEQLGRVVSGALYLGAAAAGWLLSRRRDRRPHGRS